MFLPCTLHHDLQPLTVYGILRPTLTLVLQRAQHLILYNFISSLGPSEQEHNHEDTVNPACYWSVGDGLWN